MKKPPSRWVGVLGMTAVVIAGCPLMAAGQEGTIEVEVKFAGKAVVDTVKINKDVEKCGTEKKLEKVAVGPGGGLMNAVVSLVDGNGAPTPKAMKKPVLDQKGCEFQPSVVAMMPGEIDILNSDGILHNIHTRALTSENKINKAQPKFKKVMTEKFPKPEIFPVQCDVHTWMQGWIAVMPTPYFGVTDDKGTTKIENVPAGKHTVKVWHPAAGELTKDVDVKAGQATKVAFELKKK